MQSHANLQSFYEFHKDLTAGDYKIGDIHFKFDSITDFEMDFRLGGQNITHTTINRSLHEITSDVISPALTQSLKDIAASMGCDIEQVWIKEVNFEGPGVSAGVGIGNNMKAKLNAQAAAVNVLIDTPIGEISAKLKAGAGIGSGFSGLSKLTGKSKKEFSFAFWELSYQPKEQIQSHNILELKLADQAYQDAQQFVTEIKSTTAHDPAKEKALLNKTVKQIIKPLKKQPASVPVEATYRDKEVKQGQENSKSFIDFNRSLAEQIQTAEELGALLRAGTAANIFLSQVSALSSDQHMAKFARGLGGITQTFMGLAQLNQVLKANAAATGLAIATGLMSGGSLILGGLSLISLLGTNNRPNNPSAIGEALSTLYQLNTEILSVVNMIQYKANLLNKKLDIIEQNNQVRFQYTLAAIKQSCDLVIHEISSSKHVLENRMKIGFSDITSYLDYILDKDMCRVVTKISKTPQTEWPLKLIDYSTELALWLKETATHSLKSGEISEKNDHTLPTPILIEKLKDSISSEKNYIPLGFFVSLAKHLHPELKNAYSDLKLINTQDWFYVLEVYLQLMHHCLNTITDKGLQQRYYEEVDEIHTLAKNTIYFIHTLTHIENNNLSHQANLLWETLIYNYQANLDYLRDKIIQQNNLISQPVSSLGMPVNLMENAQTYFQKAEQLSNREEAAKTLNQHLKWEGLKGVNQPEIKAACEGILMESIPKGDMNFALDQKKLNLMLNHSPAIANQFQKIQQDIQFGIASAYGIAKPAVIYFGRYLGTYPVPRWASGGYSNEFTLYICPSIELSGQYYPFAKANFFRYVNKDINYFTHQDKHGFENANDYYNMQPQVQWSPTTYSSNFHLRTDYDEHKNLLQDAVEQSVFVPARKEIVKDLMLPSALNQFLDKIQLDYLKLVGFVHLFDAEFMPAHTLDWISRLENTIKLLHETGSATNLKNLFDIVSRTVYPEAFSASFWDQNNLNSANIFKKHLLNHLNTALDKDDSLLKMMQKSELQINTLKEKLIQSDKILEGKSELSISFSDNNNKSFVSALAVVNQTLNSLDEITTNRAQIAELATLKANIEDLVKEHHMIMNRLSGVSSQAVSEQDNSKSNKVQHKSSVSGLSMFSINSSYFNNRLLTEDTVRAKNIS